MDMHCDLAKVLRTLERKGLVESRRCPDGQIRWFVTERGKVTQPDEVAISEERLS
jgi:DNA-binding MarR family transcriptional regulator